MHELGPYYGEKLTEYSDEWTATRLQNVVHSLGIEMVLAAREAVDAEADAQETKEETTEPYAAEEFLEEIKYFNGIAFDRIGEIGIGYWMIAIEPERLLLATDREFITHPGRNSICTLLELIRDDKDSKPILQKFNVFGIEKEEAPVEETDLRAIGEALYKLHEASLSLAPKKF
jgi:hypothetical protein